jgi:hypothetical protein
MRVEVKVEVKIEVTVEVRVEETKEVRVEVTVEVTVELRVEVGVEVRVEERIEMRVEVRVEERVEMRVEVRVEVRVGLIQFNVPLRGGGGDTQDGVRNEPALKVDYNFPGKCHAQHAVHPALRDGVAVCQLPRISLPDVDYGAACSELGYQLR